MKKRLIKIVCLVVAITMLALTLAACGKENQGGQEAAKDGQTWDFSINFSHGEVVSPNWARVFGPDLESASGGRIKSTIFWAGSLLSIPEIPKGLQSGTATISNMPSPNYIDVLPLNTRIVQLPFMGLQDALDSQEIYMQLYNEFPEMQKEFEDLGIKLLGATPLGRYDLKLTFKDKEVRFPEDLQGRQIVPYKNEFLPMLEQYNAAGSYIPPGQIYEALERRIAEGYIATWAYAGFFGLTDLVKQHVDFGDYGAYQEFNFFAMSLNAWNELPADLQKTITDLVWANGGYKDIYNGDTVVLIEAQKKAAEEKNDIITTLTPEEIDVWASYILPIHQQTIDEINAFRGDDAAQRIYDRTKELLQEKYG